MQCDIEPNYSCLSGYLNEGKLVRFLCDKPFEGCESVHIFNNNIGIPNPLDITLISVIQNSWWKYHNPELEDDIRYIDLTTLKNILENEDFWDKWWRDTRIKCRDQFKTDVLCMKMLQDINELEAYVNQIVAVHCEECLIPGNPTYYKHYSDISYAKIVKHETGEYEIRELRYPFIDGTFGDDIFTEIPRFIRQKDIGKKIYMRLITKEDKKHIEMMMKCQGLKFKPKLYSTSRLHDLQHNPLLQEYISTKL